MTTILKTIDQLKKYVSVNNSTQWESVEPYVKQAERKFIKTLIGTTIYNDYADNKPSGIPLEVYELLSEASANLAWFLYLPLANVTVNDEGISVAQGTDYKAAEWWQVRDLRRTFLDGGLQAIDEALKIMEANEAEFSGWETTEGYTVFKELFVKRTDTFNKWYYIANSRRTFLALRPYMRETHYQYFTAKLNEATMTVINTGTETVQQNVLELLQAAQVNYAIAKAVESGTFDITPTGIYQKIEELPGYKTAAIGPKEINVLKNDRLTAAEEYYKKALTLIEANNTLFPNYEIKADEEFVKPYNTDSIVSF